MQHSSDPLRALPWRYRIWLKLLPAHVRDQHSREPRDDLLGEQPSVLVVAMAVFQSRSATLAVGETRERISYTAVSGEFFQVFVEAPLLGRTLRSEDDVPGGSNSVVSYAFWQRVLGGDPQAVGREINVDGTFLRVVGVMPQRFRFPALTSEFWRPIGLSTWSLPTARGATAILLVAKYFWTGRLTRHRRARE